MSDSRFHREMESAARAHQSATIAILHFINELDRRKSYLDLGYSSVFDYCTRKLEYSSSTAGRLIQAAWCIRRNPEVLAMLQSRELSVSTICLIEPILDEKNKDLLRARVKGASRREVERIACECRPPMAFRDRITPVRVASANGVQNMVLMQFLASEKFAGQERRMARKGQSTPHSHRWEWDEADRSRHIPVEVRDEIFLRDGGQCSFVAADGTRCRSRKGLQIDHIRPFAAGGTHDPSNRRLLCGAHNRRAAERALGMAVMQPYWRQA